MELIGESTISSFLRRNKKTVSEIFADQGDFINSRYFSLSFSVSFRIILQGFPAARTFDGMSFVTTLPAPITVLSPIVTPGITVTLAPIQTLFPTVISRGSG